MWLTYVLLALLFFTSPSEEKDADDCTRGFMSVDRIEHLLDILGTMSLSSDDSQVIFPEVKFTCSGSIQSWIFGASWIAGSINGTLPELQIWRVFNSSNGSYRKVGSSTVTITEENATQLYYYQLSTPLPFQAGDVLGYYQPTSHLRIFVEQNGRGRQLEYNAVTNFPGVLFFYDGQSGVRTSQVLINAVTDSPDCGCGFMSVERMRLLLDLENTAGLIKVDRRQQITPDMRFTCDGMITKWIIGADFLDGEDDILYPELEIWRSTGNNTYEKINGTFIVTPTSNANQLYEYDDFPPIPFKSGDIFGAFVPRTVVSRLHLWSENVNSPQNLYLFTESRSLTRAPFDTIDEEDELVIAQNYHPLVTVEIVKTSAFLPPEMTPTSEEMSSTFSTVKTPSAVPTQSTGGNPFIGVGVSVAAVVVVLAATAIVISVTVLLSWKKKKKDQVNTTSNVAYEPSSCEFSMSINKAHDEDYVITDPSYSYAYAAPPTTAFMTSNTAYNAHKADGTGATSEPSADVLSSGDHNTTSNVAYGVSENEVELQLSRNDAYMASSNVGDTYTYEYVVSSEATA